MSAADRFGVRAAAVGLLAGAALMLLAAGERSWSQAEETAMFSSRKLTATSGAEIYLQICQGCHMPDGKGASGAGSYPALAGNVKLASARFMALTLLDGRRNMPAFGGDDGTGLFFAQPALTDEQIASVINYVRSQFGNRFKGSISAGEIAAMRRPR